MANVLIRNFPTTAFSTASDDYIAIDGTTNGTRKLSAYSPTFGGGVTVSSGATTTGQTDLLVNPTTKASGNLLNLQVNSTDKFTVTSSGKTTIADTTASTSTASGSLIVGGGIGVASAAYFGGNNWFNLGNYSGTRQLAFYTIGTNRQAFISSVGNGDYTASLRFGVNGVISDTDAIEVARITSTGLHVGPAGNAAAPVTIENATTTTSRQAGAGLRLISPAASGQTTPAIEFQNAVGTGAVIDSIRTAASFASSLRFFTSIAGTDTPTVALTLDSSQNATFTGTISTQNGTSSTPASASAAGVAGTIQWDSSYVYVCTATNTWKRAAIATW